MSSFITRHLGPTAQDVQTMLDTVGYASIEDLVDAAVPEDIRITEPLNLPAPLSEEQAQDRLREMAGKNQVKTQMIGQGFYNTFTPAVIRRNVVENPTWYTAYTPYQAEISQGRLEALLNFQTMVMDLTGLELANASLLDEASAAAEAMLMMRRANRKKSKGIILVDENIFPQTLSVVTSRATMVDLEIDVRDLSNPDNVTDNLPEEGLCGIILQQPGNNGGIRDQSEVIATAKEAGGFVTVIADLLALTLITLPVRKALTLRWVTPSDSVCPCSTVVRTRLIWPLVPGWSVPCRAVWWVFPLMTPEPRPTVWPYKPANSTFDVTGRPPISAPRRHCWRSLPPCTPCTTDRPGYGRLPPMCMPRPACSARPSPRPD